MTSSSNSLEALFSYDAPEHFIDTFTDSLYSEPCVLGGRIYEKKEIETWVAKNHSDPYTRNRADLRDIKTVLKSSIGLDLYLNSRVKQFFVDLKEDAARDTEKAMKEFVYFMSCIALHEQNSEEHYVLARRLSKEVVPLFPHQELISCILTNCSHNKEVFNVVVDLVTKASQEAAAAAAQASTTPANATHENATKEATLPILNTKSQDQHNLLITQLQQQERQIATGTPIDSSSFIPITQMMLPELKNDIVKQGLIFKKAKKGLKKWASRYLVVTKESLLLYKSETDARQDLGQKLKPPSTSTVPAAAAGAHKVEKKILRLDGASVSKTAVVSYTSRKNCFLVSDLDGKNKWVLRANGEQDRETWLNLVKLCIFLYH